MGSLKKKTIITFLSLFYLYFSFTSPVLAGCDDPACTVGVARHGCDSCNTRCGRQPPLVPGGDPYYSGQVVVNFNDCAALNGGLGCDCNPATPGCVNPGDCCVWAANFSEACGDCCWGGGGGPTEERVVGRVWKDGEQQKGYTITSDDGKAAGWRDDENGLWYRIGRWPVGTAVTMDLQLKGSDAGRTCRWNLYMYDSGGDSGDGCSATFTITHGQHSINWHHHLTWYIEPGANVLGRVASNEGLVEGTWYWRGGNCSGCGGSCHPFADMRIECDGQEVGWDCNAGGAFYGLGGLPVGDATCTISNLPEGYNCSDSEGNETSCSITRTLVQGDNHIWFWIDGKKDIYGTAYDVNTYATAVSACLVINGDTTPLAGEEQDDIVVNCRGGDCGPEPGINQTTGPAGGNPSGYYVFEQLAKGEDYTLMVDDAGDAFFCSATGAEKSTNISDLSEDTEKNLGWMQGVDEAWWQAVGGDVHADGQGSEVIKSSIPYTCGQGGFDFCHDYILRSDMEIDAGILSYSGSSINPGEGEGAESGWIANSDYDGDRTDYEFFLKAAQDQVELKDGPTTWTGGNPEEGYYHFEDLVTINSDEPWDALDNKVVFYINDDLNINGDITLGSDGFAAFVVSGNVTISETVTDIQGVIITDGSITVSGTGSSDDLQLKAEGIFVAWSGFNLNRNLGFNMAGDPDNRGDPAEMFTYNPDLLRRAPAALKKPKYTWVEVAP